MDDLVIIKSFFFVLFFSLGDMVVTRSFNMKDCEDREKKNNLLITTSPSKKRKEKQKIT
jgi:hypothetical protein